MRMQGELARVYGQKNCVEELGLSDLVEPF